MGRVVNDRKLVLKLTRLEFDVLWRAALSIGDDLDYMGLTPAKKSAYHRVMRKLRSAPTERDKR